MKDTFLATFECGSLGKRRIQDSRSCKIVCHIPLLFFRSVSFILGDGSVESSGEVKDFPI